MDDAALANWMVQAQAGNAEAYRLVLRASLPVAAACARRVGVPTHAVDDVVQDVLLTMHRALATYDPARPFAPWLRAIATRRAIDALRRQGRTSGREVHDPDAYENFAAAPDQSEAADAGSEARRLRAAIATLPARQRQAVELLGLAEQSLEEAAQKTGQTKVALKVSLHRALHSLRARLGATRDE